MGKYINPTDLLGVKINRLTCKSFYKEGGIDYLIVSCDCGNEKAIRKKVFTNGKTLSCGCAQREHVKLLNEARQGVPRTHGMSDTVEYIAWKNMKARCDDINHNAYANYGGRGIKYCEDWGSFESFYRDMGLSNGLTLDRIDVNGDYCAENCVWVCNQQQAFNRRKMDDTTSTFKGVSFNKDFGKYKAGIVFNGINLHLGYSDDPELLACRYDRCLSLIFDGDVSTNLSLGLTSKTLDDYDDKDFDKFYKRIQNKLQVRI